MLRCLSIASVLLQAVGDLRGVVVVGGVFRTALCFRGAAVLSEVLEYLGRERVVHRRGKALEEGEGRKEQRQQERRPDGEGDALQQRDDRLPQVHEHGEQPLVERRRVGFLDEGVEDGGEVQVERTPAREGRASRTTTTTTTSKEETMKSFSSVTALSLSLSLVSRARAGGGRRHGDDGHVVVELREPVAVDFDVMLHAEPDFQARLVAHHLRLCVARLESSATSNDRPRFAIPLVFEIG